MNRDDIDRELAEIGRYLEFWTRTERDARENVIHGRIRQAELLRLLDRGGGTVLPSAAATNTAPVPRLRSLAAQIMVEALEKAGPRGLSGGELNKLVVDGGLSKDAAEKAKVKIKRAGQVFHDETGRRWYALNAVPPHLQVRTPEQD
ncbi:hypothetical protein [Enterovirga aerilata]|uniref:Uncharacterized protein n=1 Tax=Enterovirga aerilata TaxID=2730920 RepID=A0A849ICR1_9HYPH|nr:hypothetical protein [Enterovirga sp. DB1703]NNM74209.1 hypothetical protein [Enterovirga sp. DB1703]